METKQFTFDFEVYNSPDDLQPDDRLLLESARQATGLAYAPYSNFKVGASARMKNGRLVSGANQENAAFPAGLCAEGVVMASASALYPQIAIDTLAVAYLPPSGSGDHPVAPCGICRQSLQEFAMKTGGSIRLILAGTHGGIYIIADAAVLLPLAFSKEEFKGG